MKFIKLVLAFLIFISSIGSYSMDVKSLGYQKPKVSYKNGILYIYLEDTKKVTNVIIYDRFNEKIGGSTVQTNNGRYLTILLQLKEPKYKYVINYQIENGNVIVSFIDV